MKLVKSLLLATVAGLLVSGSELTAQPKQESGFVNWIRNHKKTAATLAVATPLTLATAYYLYRNDMLTAENVQKIPSQVTRGPKYVYNVAKDLVNSVMDKSGRSRAIVVVEEKTPVAQVFNAAGNLAVATVATVANAANAIATDISEAANVLVFPTTHALASEVSDALVPATTAIVADAAHVVSKVDPVQAGITAGALIAACVD